MNGKERRTAKAYRDRRRLENLLDGCAIALSKVQQHRALADAQTEIAQANIRKVLTRFKQKGDL